MNSKEDSAEAERADEYNRTGDLFEFDGGDTEALRVARRDVTISVRFTEQEIAQVRRLASQVDMKVTAYIRAAALEAGRPLDRATLARLAGDLEQRAHELREAVG